MTSLLGSPWEYVARLFEPRGRRYTNPGHLAAKLDPKHGTSPALDAIDDALVELMDPDSEQDALAVYMPPQEGKSQKCSRRFPEWLLDHDPTLRIAIVSYEMDTALRWGRDIKNDIALNRCPGVTKDGRECQEDCGGLHISIRRDSAAAARWETPAGGGVYCVGVGGPLTGRPVDVLIIDDPVKDRAAAESKTIRDLTWDWWESVALTRLAPGAKVVLIQCMTGDTPVLMGDGTDKLLRDVRPGDTVATYEDGGVSVSTVRNWTSQGLDSVYRIRMKSGAVVKANARHPFLTIQDGTETWQRTDQLKPGSRILRATGVSGAASTAHAVSQPASRDATAKGSACPATTSSAGPMDTGRHRSTRRRGGQRTSSTATASRRKSTTGWLRSKVASALSANGQTGSLPTGTHRSVSIIAMTQAAYAACSAMTATLSSATPPQKQLSAPLPTTYGIEADEVIAVEPCGTEEVFDIQVDRTENFIANGLISHNTRWHEDDLGGRLETRPGPLNWRVLKIPAIAEAGDPLGRKPGQELQSVRNRAVGYFRRLKATMSAYVFSGVYQQTPTAPEGNFFRKQTFRYWRDADPWPDGRERINCEGQLVTMVDTWRFITMDFAASSKVTADWTVASVWAVTLEGDLILLDRMREHLSDHDHFRMTEPLRVQWKVDQIWVESNWWSSTFVSDARNAGVPVAMLKADTDKVTRAVPAAGRVHSGKVFFPALAAWLDEWESELLTFPKATHDDQVDTLSYAARIVVNEWTPGTDLPRPGLTAAEQAINTAASAALGHSGGIDLMNVAY